jgi:hypothetical protein
MRKCTLEQVEIMGLPAVYHKRYDTRALAYDGERFAEMWRWEMHCRRTTSC